MLLYYPDGRSINIPDIDAPDWMRIHGLTAQPRDESAHSTASEPVAIASKALALINEAATIDQIAVLPTIGKAGATLILESRPEAGYPSLAVVWEQCPRLLSRPYNVNPATVEAWDADTP